MKMTNRGLLTKYERIHAYFLADPRFWYEKGRQEADKIICVLASDLRREIQLENSAADYVTDYQAYVRGMHR